MSGRYWKLGKSVRVKRALLALAVVVAAFAGLSWYGRAGADAPEAAGPPIEIPLQPKSVECAPLTFDAKQIWSERALEDALIHDIRVQMVEIGHVDWDCLEREFLHLSPRASTLRLLGGGFDGADVYRFKLDRSNNPIAIMWGGWGPGAPNGEFFAIFNATRDGKIAVIRGGGRPEWLRLESKEKP